MTEEKGCPFCKAKASGGCRHLALAVRARDFVPRCVEKAQAQALWEAFCQQTRKAQCLEGWGGLPDFAWIESAFCDEFLKRLGWFGEIGYQWRTYPQPGHGGDLWVLLWSKDPQRLWWELRDELGRQALEADRGPDENPVRCPVCAISIRGNACGHLMFRGDDLKTETVIEHCGAGPARRELTKLLPDFLPQFAGEFFEKFKAHFPALAGTRSEGWNEGTLRLGGVSISVWALEPSALRKQVAVFVEQKLAELKKKQ